MADAKTGADWMALYSDRALRSLGRRDEARAIQERLAVLRPDDVYVTEELEALKE